MASTTTSASPAKTDPAYGRTPGLRPPLTAWAPLVWIAALAAVLAFVVIALVRPPGPLDDGAPAFQRDGLLLNGPVLPTDVLDLPPSPEVRIVRAEGEHGIAYAQPDLIAALLLEQLDSHTRAQGAVT